jgi:hypothetical protein
MLRAISKKKTDEADKRARRFCYKLPFFVVENEVTTTKDVSRGDGQLLN